MWPFKRRSDDDFRREIEAHVSFETDRSIADGMSPEEARAAAIRRFGNVTAARERFYESGRIMWLDELRHDIRDAIRAFRRSPGFTAVVVFTLAIGTGANTAIFSAVYAVLLRPLPYPHAEQLVRLADVCDIADVSGDNLPDFQYAAWRDQARIFAGIAAYTIRRPTITGAGDAEQLRAAQVPPAFLRTLGASPFIGRDFAAGPGGDAGTGVALLTYSLWRTRFGGDRAILSKQLMLDGKPYSIAGVLPPDFEFPGVARVRLLIAMPEPAPQPNGALHFYSVIARLKPGVAVQRARADLRLINRRLAPSQLRTLGQFKLSDTSVTGLHDQIVGDVRPALLALAGAVAMVLLIACVNVSNLQLARAITRQREMALRIALGAARGRILRQLLTEGILLALAGGAAGLALAFGGVRLLAAIAPAGVPHLQDAGIGAIVFAFNSGIALGAGILFGLAPFRFASATDPDIALKEAGRTASGSRTHRRLENLLVVSETALALILLSGAGLLLRTFAAYNAIEPGFRPDDVYVARLVLPSWRFPGERQRAVLETLLQSVRSGPTVEGASLVGSEPYGGLSSWSAALEIEGRPRRDRTALGADSVTVNSAAGDYFRVMGIPVLQGRGIDESDRAGRTAVAVINEKLARQFFPHGHAVGSRVRVGAETRWREIVGVARDMKQRGLASEPRAEIWLAAAQEEDGYSAQTLVVRSPSNPNRLLPWLRTRIAAVDRDLPQPEIRTMRSQMALLIGSQVFVLRLLATFAAIACALAAVGIYSVLAYSVERRHHEIGIRVALGANPSRVAGLVVGRGLRLAVAGAALGFAGAIGLTRYLNSLLYGVTPHDPVTLAAACALLVCIALGAAWLPARRAMNQDAAAVLRAE
jgi:putative ABC transport system permease protein